jgi:hypothetical protein
LERDKDILAMKKPSAWLARGRDNRGPSWEGYLYVEQAPEAFMTSGFFQWSTTDAGGRYHFEGKFDPKTRRVRWTSFTVKDPVANGGANAHYEAALSADGRKLLGGTWKGGICIPGTWSAERID